MADLNDIFQQIANNSGTTFLAGYSVSTGQPYPLCYQWQVKATYADAGPAGQSIISAFFPFSGAPSFLLFAGEDCTLGDVFGKDLQLGDEEFDKQFRIKSKQPNFVRAVLNDANLRAALISQKNIRIEFIGTEEHGATLEITSYVHAIDIDEMVFRIALASQLLDGALHAHIEQVQGGSGTTA